MKTKKSLLLLCLFLTTQLKAQDTTRVLFIGNSITYFNNMPQTFEAIANSKGDPTEVTVYAPGGTGFIHHVVDNNVYEHFQQGIWDYVVLQPGSNESPGYSEPIDLTINRAMQLKDSIKFYNPCAKVLFYEISYGVWGSSALHLDSYNSTMDAIRNNLEELSDSTESFFAPAGEVMRAAWNADPSTMIWGGFGDIHPNAKGSYMIACAFYSTIFQKPSSGTSEISSLSVAEALIYQELADSIVLNHLPDWRVNTFYSFTDFDYTLDLLNVHFNSLSLNIDSLTWNFGDGNFSDSSNVNHVYADNSVYYATLNTYKNGCLYTKTKVVDLSFFELNTNHYALKPNIYPNPFSDKITIENYIEGEVLIFNQMGQDFSNSVSITKTLNGIEINTVNLPSGTYLIKTKNTTNVICKQ